MFKTFGKLLAVGFMAAMLTSAIGCEVEIDDNEGPIEEAVEEATED